MVVKREHKFTIFSISSTKHIHTVMQPSPPSIHRTFQKHRFFFFPTPKTSRASLIAQLVKNLPAMQETPVQFLGQGFAGGGIGYPLQYSWASLVAQLVKNPRAM